MDSSSLLREDYLGTAASGAITETDNNYLGQKAKTQFTASEQKEFDEAIKSCPGQNALCDRARELAGNSQARDAQLASACTVRASALCGAAVRVAQEMGNVVFFGPDGPHAFPENSPVIQATPDPRDGTFHYTLAASVTEGLAIDVTGVGVATVGAAVRGLGAATLEKLLGVSAETIVTAEGAANQVSGARLKM